MEKYAFFLDIDGTLYDGTCVPEENIRAIKKAISEGHYVFISTGRSYINIGDTIRDILPWSGVISSAGAEIRIGDEKIVKTISGELAEKVIDFSLKREGWACISHSTKALIVNIEKRHEWWHTITSSEQVKEEFPVLEITKIDFEGAISKEFEEVLETEMYLHYYETFCEAVVKGCSKSEAIKLISERLGIPRERTVAMGDSGNDIDAIVYAGIGVAMGNAHENVKKEADMISANCSEGGVGKAMERILYEI